jgi:hypothetical protein
MWKNRAGEIVEEKNDTMEAITELLDAGGDLVKVDLLFASIALDDEHFLMLGLE